MRKFCTACGAENAVEANFCKSCGAKLSAPPPNASAGELPRQAVQIFLQDVLALECA